MVNKGLVYEKSIEILAVGFFNIINANVMLFFFAILTKEDNFYDLIFGSLDMDVHVLFRRGKRYF